MAFLDFTCVTHANVTRRVQFEFLKLQSQVSVPPLLRVTGMFGWYQELLTIRRGLGTKLPTRRREGRENVY